MLPRHEEADGASESRLSQPPRTIAIDGPVASGKSSVGLRLSQRWGHVFIDTGMMYRAMTWWALHNRVAPGDGAALSALAKRTHMRVTPTTEGTSVSIDGIDATPHLRDPDVERAVSLVSAAPAVREAMVAEQRRLAASQAVIMAGRDIGTVVLPDAGLKVYLDASVARRAERRAAESPRGVTALAEVAAALRERDRIDSERDVSPLRPAAGAVIINTDDLTLDDVVERIAALAERTDGGASE